MKLLEGKVAIITGASRGIGSGIAKVFAEQGANVAFTYSSSVESAMALENELNALGIKAKGYKSNAADFNEAQKLVDDVIAEFGTIDVLINNAGIIRREDAIDFSEKNWDDVMNINAKTVFFFSQAVANQFIKQGHGGKIISIASMLSYQGGIRVPSYTASKSAVKGITMTMANEWAKYNINVNAIAPGYMATNNTAALRDDEKRAGEILERIPAGRWGTPKDVAGAAVFLASDNANYIHGFTLAVDGGWLGR